ncbi:MAG: hypothetical protein QW046_04090 [Candidatus Micrarchaeaceae archaeon]
MRYVVKTNNKIVVLNPTKDITIWSDDHNLDRGTDLLLHKTQNNENVYYLFHWSAYTFEKDYIEIISRNHALDFILENGYNNPLSDEKYIFLLKYFPELKGDESDQ